MDGSASGSEKVLGDGVVSVVVPSKPFVGGNAQWPAIERTPASLRWKHRIRRILDTTSFQITMLILLLYVLFVNNIATLAEAPDTSIEPINVTLVLSLILFSVELTANAWSQRKRDGLYLFLEVVGTLSILLEITWVADKIIPEEGLKTENVSRTAIITSRAGRVTRLLRLIRFIRALKMFMMIRRYFARKVDSNERPESMAPSSMGNTLADRISVLVAFLVMVTMMMVMLLQTSTVDRSPQALLNTLEFFGNEPKESLQPFVDDVLVFINEGDANISLKILQIGTNIWDWTDETGGFSGKANDRLELTGESEDVKMVIDVSEQNKDEALYDMLLGLVIIFELCIFVALLHKNTARILVAPLERIFNTIRTNASQIINALEETEEDIDGEERTEIDTIEAAINKMSKLVAHVTSSGTQGAHVVKDYMEDEHASDDTKAWLKDFINQTPKSAESETHAQERRASMIKPVVMERSKTMDRVKAGLVETTGHGTPEIIRTMAEIDVDLLNSWDWDVTKRTHKELMASICIMFEELDLAGFEGDCNTGTDDAKPLVFMEVLWEFIDKVRLYYQDVPYHNFYHCSDVTHACYRFVILTLNKALLSKVEKFALMVAALCHDMDHPGYNNAFLVNSKHELARVYNDNSVLENRHVSCLYTLVAENEKANIFGLLDDATWKEVRSMVIQAILHTDMVHHFPMVSKIEVFFELHSAALRTGDFTNIFSSAEDRVFLLNMLLHCADISNPVKPLEICKKWADRVLGEFFRQGDLEREKGLSISPMCNRETTSKAASQINFIEFIVAPLYFHVAKIFPELSAAVLNLWDNRRLWDEQYILEIEANSKLSTNEKEEDKRKARHRLTAFYQKYKDVLDEPRNTPTKATNTYLGNLPSESGMLEELTRQSSTVFNQRATNYIVVNKDGMR
ncbi:hypothetical protein BSKO_14165 [Bryopsis sp. KO-2023]|nr:hypothetical protein BSKO_14165 [Bryopsis sp. KO-2023]